MKEKLPTSLSMFAVFGFVIPDGTLKRLEGRIGFWFIDPYILLRVRLRTNKARAD